jgi:hypothetical protein
MIVALIDNGSLEPAAHRNLRALAAALSERTGVRVQPVSWKHSDRIRPEVLDGTAADTLTPWMRQQTAAGERHFVFIPFFVSAQGAIGSALREDLERLQAELGGFRFAFTTGLAAHGNLTRLVVSRIRDTIAANRLSRPPVIVVDHGGPSAASAALRDQIALAVARELGAEIGSLRAASLEGEEYAHNRPLFADALALPGFDRGDVVIAPLFLAPGRHAGPRGDLAQIATAAEDRLTPLRCHFTALLGTHPEVLDMLATALHQTLSTFHAAA